MMRLNNWWAQREPRERQVLAGGALIIIMVAFYLIIEPVLMERERMSRALPDMYTDLAWMQTHANQVKSMLSSTPRTSTGSSTLSLSSVQSLLEGMSLQDAVKELGTASGQTIRIRFEKISFPELVELIYLIRERTSAKVSSASFSRITDSPGSIQATLILGKG